MLQDIHLPSAAWWPPAPGWWLVAGLVVLSVAVVAWWVWRRAGRRSLRAALRAVDVLAAAYARDGDDPQLADGASRLLRRVACMVDRGAASESGNPWRKFLHDYARDTATQEALDQLIDARFQPRPVLDAPALLAALRRWCRTALRGNGRRVTRRLGVKVSSTRRFAAIPFVPMGVNARVRRGEKGAPS